MKMMTHSTFGTILLLLRRLTSDSQLVLPQNKKPLSNPATGLLIVPQNLLQHLRLAVGNLPPFHALFLTDDLQLKQPFQTLTSGPGDPKEPLAPLTPCAPYRGK